MNVCDYIRRHFVVFDTLTHSHSFWVSYSSSPFVTLLLVYYWFVELREESNRLTLFIERDTVWELVEGMLRALYCSYLNAASICHYDCGIRRELEAGVIGTWRILDTRNSQNPNFKERQSQRCCYLVIAGWNQPCHNLNISVWDCWQLLM